MRTLVALTAAAFLLSAACSNDHRSSTAAASTASAAVDAADAPLASGAASAEGGAADATAVAAQPADATAAAAAFEAYLEALRRGDARAALDNSSGPASGLATIRLAIADINAARGGTTTTTVSDPSYQPAVVNPGVVTFDGSVHLVSDVAGSLGTQHSDDVIGGPITVRFDGTVWRVDDFVYNSAPMAHVASGASQTVSGLTLSVAFVQSYGTTTAVVVGLGADSGTVEVTLEQATLTTADGVTPVTGDFTKATHPAGVLNGGRRDATPTRFDATFRRGDGTTVAFSVPL